MATEVRAASLVDEICANAQLDAEMILRLKTAARWSLAEQRALKSRHAELTGEDRPQEEKALRLAVFAWLLCRQEQAEAALRNVAPPLLVLLQGEMALDRGEYAKAAELLATAAAKLPNAGRVLVELAGAQLAAGQAAEAAKTVAELERKGRSPEADLLYLKGRLLEEDGRAQEATARYDAAVASDPSHAEAAFRLAYHLDLRGDDQRATELYKKVREQSPAFISATVNLALLLEDQNEVDSAITLLREAQRADPANRRVALHLRDATESLSMCYDESERKEGERLEQVLRIPISDFELSVRSRNCLVKMNVRTLGDLVRRSEQELLAFKNFGETSLSEMRNLLQSKGLRFGMFREEEARRARAQRLRTGGGESSVLAKPITDLELSVRARRCMQKLNIETVGDLAEKTEAELLAVKNFGQTSLNELKAKMGEMGVSLRVQD